jgi:hypothetical protein
LNLWDCSVVTLTQIDEHSVDLEKFDAKASLHSQNPILRTASDLWVQAPLNQKQASAAAVFPDGVVFDARKCSGVPGTSQLEPNSHLASASRRAPSSSLTLAGNGGNAVQ